MNKDLDERLLPDGMIRHGENILIINSESSDIGSIQNSYSNKQLTFYDFGENPKCLLGFNDEAEDKLYWFVKSDRGCYLAEWDNINQLLSIVLADTRPNATRVLNLDENHLITGIEKIISENSNQDLLVWTDDNMQPCCINIERAKTYGENGFEEEDIFLIKKPPRYAPDLTPVLQDGLSNNMEDKFFSFSYRYKYLDGEYSALSDYTNYEFTPKDFELDYYVLDNIGMINAFNAVKIAFNTGDKRVTDIQLVVKESNSNNLYIIETFNKIDEGWRDNQVKSYLFSNSKKYTILPENELYRSFDNVPLKAKALTSIGNRLVFGNYLEGYDLLDNEGNKIVIDYNLALVSESIEINDVFQKTFLPENKMGIQNLSSVPLLKGNRLIFYFSLLIDTDEPTYNNSFFYVLDRNYATLHDVFITPEFISFLQVVSNDFVNNYTWPSMPADWSVITDPSITYSLISGVPTFVVNPVTFEDTTDDSTHVVNFKYLNTSYLSLIKSTNSSSCKTNKDYEVGIVYMDKYNRKSTVLTSSYNTLFIAQQHSIFKNKIQILINSKPPYWADRYKVVVKTKPLQYQTIYINKFYNEEFFTWCKLEAENKDKVKVGDSLIVKRAGAIVITKPITVKVLEIKEKEKNFIVGNQDDNGNQISEEAGIYMKIRPDKFSMDISDFKVHQSWFGDTRAGNGQYPSNILWLFSELTPPPVNGYPPVAGTVVKELAIPAGSSIYLYINSSSHMDSGWQNNTYEKTHYAQRNYDTIEEWFLENIMNRPLYGNVGNNNDNYEHNLILFRKYFDRIHGWQDHPNAPLGLQIIGTRAGGDRGRYGYVRASIVVRTGYGEYVFETDPVQSDTEIYYENEQTFDIEDGNHLTNNQGQDQDISTFTPAVIDLDFFNCYTQGNGVESYRIKDAFNKKYLNIDLRPSSTSVEAYKSIRRYADLTYSESFVESTNVNGLNVFNLSTANFKELDKQPGSIQKLHSRDGDILVLQEEKASKVMYGKDAIYNADGSVNVTSIEEVLGQQVFYLGENGIGKNPESFAVNDYQVFYSNALRGLVQKLSISGVDSMVNGMSDYFRDLFIKKPLAKKLGGFDPYHNQFFLSVSEEPTKIYDVQCSNTVIKHNVQESFSYNFNINDLVGDIVLNYNITSGNATITAFYDGNYFVVSNVNGIGNITIPRTIISERIVLVTVTPVTETISFEIANVCPLGIPMKVVSIILNDETDEDNTIVNRYRWSGSSFYSENDVFLNTQITRFSEEIGIEGQGRFPNRGSIVNLQSYKDLVSTGKFRSNQCNRLGYLVTNNIYTSVDIDTILSTATFITVTETIDGLSNETNSGNFLFSRTADDEILYLIWDYTDRRPIANNDTIITHIGGSINIAILDNDLDPEGMPLTVTIVSGPNYGTAVLGLDNTITYSHDSSSNHSDIIVYEISNGICSTQATIHISITDCGVSFSGASSNGDGSPMVFEHDFVVGDGIGYTGLRYNVGSKPARYELIYDGVVVADSKFVCSVAARIAEITGTSNTVDVFNFISGTGWTDTGEDRTVNITSGDVNTTELTGYYWLYFNKTTPNPTTFKLRVTLIQDFSGWGITNVMCPQETIPE